MLILALGLFSSCGKNRLKTDEKELTKQILTEEQQLAQEAKLRAKHEKQLADSIAKLPKGFRFKEEREVDSENPPVEIDIIASRQNPKSIKLSQLFSKIDYIILELLPDSAFYNSNPNFILNNNSIYGASSKGIAQYDRQGHFIKYICQNELHSTKINGTEMTFENDFNQFVGGTQAKIVNGKLYYKFENRAKKLASFMEYDEGRDGNDIILNAFDNELTKPLITGLGRNISSSQVRRFGTFAAEIYPLGGNFFANVAARKGSAEGKNYITLSYTNGDTLCSFVDYDMVTNYHRSLARVSAPGNSYVLNGNLYTRKAYHDTIFQVVIPNRLIPHIILDFGGQGITESIQWMDPGYDLTGKLILQDLLETKQYLFITYTRQVSSDSKDLLFSRLIYDKRTKALYSVYVDEKPRSFEAWFHNPYAPEINIENDIDHKPFLWPDHATEQGVAYTFFTPEQFAEKLGTSAGLFFTNISNKSYIIAIYQ
jgi:hypothetical protein